MKYKAVFLGDNADTVEKVFGQGRRQRVAELTELLPGVIGGADLAVNATALRDVEVAFSTWGMPGLDADQIRTFFPSLKGLFYAAGSVRGFARPFLEQGIRVVSAWQANAVPVAEFTVAQIILAGKGYWRNIREYVAPAAYGSAFRGPGNFGGTVVLLGAGAIGRAVIQRLQAFALTVLVWDPFLSAEQARALGVEKVEDLAAAFQRGFVVSNHLADVPETRGLLTAAHFAAMPAGAVFINTGRGGTVVEADLARVLQERPDLTALLDVTEPEPPLPDSPFYALPNVHITTHIAGSMNDEVVRMADYVIADFTRWESGQELCHEVTLAMLATMA